MMTVVRRVLWIIALALASPPGWAETYRDAVALLGFEALGETFTEQKVEAILSPNMPEGLPAEERRALAVLRVLGAPETEPALSLYVTQAAEPDGAFLGYLGEASIYQRLAAVWSLSGHRPRSDFSYDLRALIQRGVANGYNIVTTPWPAFDPERHLIYGHSDIAHAQQLLALLASEGLQARVGFSLKTSAFRHREGWGEVPAGAVDLGGGRFLIEAMEFDLHFELTSAHDKARFMAIINRYAKKAEGQSQPLIAGAWWQPFYRSRVAAPAFGEVASVALSDGRETARILVLPAQAEALVRDINALGRPWETERSAVWVNPAFYRYLQGDFQ
ncbi:hypothetical protein [Marinimicrobium agarilyticum]|uniref:hypothetical protein n=1 Tax=Marinimicrobium agarilyticum TaxID=306546 RepID=UPI0004186EA3|nr:hypothetical protein [Marinimicrobium agarilyticum]